MMKQLVISCITFSCNLLCNYSWNEMIQETSLFEKRTNRFLRIKKICSKIKFEWFWKNNIEGLKEYSLEEIIVFFNNINDDSKFVLSKLLYFSGKYDDEICEYVLDFAKNTNNTIYRYWTTMDISRFTFHQQKGFYLEYYNDRRALLKQICDELELKVPSKKIVADNKLCIVTSMLDNSLKNSTQRVATMISTGLISEFDEVKIFPLDIFTPMSKENNMLTTVFSYNASIKSKDEICKHFPVGAKVHFPVGTDYKEKAQDVLDAIYDFNPSAILDMSDEYSAISYYYSKDFYMSNPERNPSPVRCMEIKLPFIEKS